MNAPRAGTAAVVANLEATLRELTERATALDGRPGGRSALLQAQAVRRELEEARRGQW